MTIAMFLTGLLAARLSARFGARAVLAAGAALTGGPFAVLAWASGQPWEVYLASTLIGAGLGLAYAALSAIVVAAVPSHQTGVATGMNANIRTIGGALGNAVTASIVTARASQLGLPLASGYTAAFAFLLAAGAVAVAVSLLVPRAGRAEPGAVASAAHGPGPAVSRSSRE